MRLSPLFMTTRLTVALLICGATACAGGDAAAGGGTLILETATDGGSLFPPLASQFIQSRAVSEQIFEKLAEMGPGLNTVGDVGFEPRLAKTWTWSRDSLALTFHLDPAAKWHDGKSVTSADVTFGYAVYLDPAVGSSSGPDFLKMLDSVTASDSLTVTVWYKRRTPEMFFNFVYGFFPLPKHLLAAVPRDSMRTFAFGRAPVGNGPFKLVKWDAGSRIELAAVPDFFRGRAKVDRLIWTVAPEASTLVQRLFAGEADFLEVLSAADVQAATAHPDVRVVVYPGLGYNYLAFNLHDGASDRPHPVFGNRELRRALSMAVDRKAMVKNVLDSLGVAGMGPLSHAQWSADTSVSQIPFDTTAAARALDSLGWKRSADGMRAKNGRALSFSVIVPSTSKTRVRYAALLQEQWRLAGVKVDVENLDGKAMTERASKHSFDSYINGLTVSPSPSGLRQTWTTGGSSASNAMNTGRYSNSTFDAQVDSALQAVDQKAARSHYRAAYRIIVDDAPAIWLYEPGSVAGAHKRLVTGPLRPGTWWTTIANWSIAPGGRLPRDAAPRSQEKP